MGAPALGLQKMASDASSPGTRKRLLTAVVSRRRTAPPRNFLHFMPESLPNLFTCPLVPGHHVFHLSREAPYEIITPTMLSDSAYIIVVSPSALVFLCALFYLSRRFQTFEPVCVCPHACAQMCMCACANGGQRPAPSIFLIYTPY